MSARPPARTPRALVVLLAAALALPALPMAAPPAKALPTVNPSCFLTNRAVDVTLVIDRSGSMSQHDNGSPTSRIQDAQNAATQFLSSLGPNDQSSLISFSTDWRIDQSMTHHHDQTIWHEQQLAPYGFTSMWAGVRLGLYELENNIDRPGSWAWAFASHSNDSARLGDPDVQQVLILLTDGAQTDSNGFNQAPPGSPSPIDEAAWGKARGAMVFTIAVGTDDPTLTPWLPVLQEVASTPRMAFQAPSGPTLNATLSAIFAQIRVQMRDAAPPSVSIAEPAAGVAYAAGAPAGFPSPFGDEPAIRHSAPVTAVATDDCLVSKVTYAVDVFRDGAYDHTLALSDANNATAPYAASINCDDLPAGRHLLHAYVEDFVSKTNSTQAWFWCVRPSIRSEAFAAYARNTNPPDLGFSSPGARLQSDVGGSQRVVTENLHETQAPADVDLSLLWEDVASTTPVPTGEPSFLAADALARVANATLSVGAASQRLELFEAEVNTSIAADTPFGQPWTLAETGRAQERSLTGTEAWVDDDQPRDCQTVPVPFAAPPNVQQCVGKVVVLPDGLTLLLHEELRSSGPGWSEVTVNALHLIRDRPDQRSELILGQAYGGASLVGDAVLHGAQRNLSLQNDAGSGGDAGDLAAPLPLAQPGVYQGRIADANDVDAYTLQVVPGEKLQVTIVPAYGAFATLAPQPPLPSAAVPGVEPKAPSFSAVLVAPDGSVRQVSNPLLVEPVTLELNVDEPGLWEWGIGPGGAFSVSGATLHCLQSTTGVVCLPVPVGVPSAVVGGPGDYTMIVSRVPAPMTHDNDALALRDAPPDCADGLLVGPGVHVGTLEDGDQADAYRFQAYEGQTIALVLRPGDTPDAADMSLSFYAPDCTLLRAVDAHGPFVKGFPDLITYKVPPGASGLYGAVVGHVNGIGTYELAIAPAPET